ncbi:hypothetical protein Ancab_026167 [Ancistrocladus abbreviatus]
MRLPGRIKKNSDLFILVIASSSGYYVLVRWHLFVLILRLVLNDLPLKLVLIVDRFNSGGVFSLRLSGKVPAGSVYRWDVVIRLCITFEALLDVEEFNSQQFHDGHVMEFSSRFPHRCLVKQLRLLGMLHFACHIDEQDG